MPEIGTPLLNAAGEPALVNGEPVYYAGSNCECCSSEEGCPADPPPGLETAYHGTTNGLALCGTHSTGPPEAVPFDGVVTGAGPDPQNWVGPPGGPGAAYIMIGATKATVNTSLFWDPGDDGKCWTYSIASVASPIPNAIIWWVGRRAGPDPTGDYQRTGGCSATPDTQTVS